jgi:hypothetical protein
MIYKFLGGFFFGVGVWFTVLYLTAPRNETYHNCEVFWKGNPGLEYVNVGKRTVIITDTSFQLLDSNGLNFKIHAAYENADEITYFAETPQVHYFAENKHLFTIRLSNKESIQIFKPK